MEHTPRTILFKSLGVIFFILVIIFGFSRFGRYIYGPQIVDISLAEYQSIEAHNILVTGRTSNTETMRINGRIITLSDEQEFSEIVVLSPGSSIIEVDVQDAFGKTKTYSYSVYSTLPEYRYESTYQETQDSSEETDDTSIDDLSAPEDIIIPN